MSSARFDNRATPKKPPIGTTILYVDEADKHTKQIDDDGVVKDLTPQESAATLATAQQYFDKDATTAATPAQIANDSSIQSYSVKGNTGAVTVVLTPGSAGYNLLTGMLEANESTAGTKPDYFNISNVAQATYLDETANKFLFPSNLYTYNNAYAPFNFRVISTIDYPAVGSNQSTVIMVRLRRFIDDSIISTKEFILSNALAGTDFVFTTEFLTFAGSEADPYVVDGMYVDIANSSDSDTNFTLKLCDIRMFRI